MGMLSKKRKIQLKRIVLLIGLVYVIAIYSGLYVPGVNSFFSSVVADDDISIGGGNNDDKNSGGSYGDTKTDNDIDVFNAQTFIVSNYEQKTGHDVHLYAFPGHRAELYRDFAIYIFVDKPAMFLIKIDDQKVDEGSVEWRYIHRSHSEYNFMDVTIIVKDDKTGAQRTFEYERIDLLNSPWQVGKGEDKEEEKEEEPEIVKPYFSLGRGEFTMFILLRVVADAASVLLGAFIGIKLAAIKADLVGVQRMF